MKDEVVIEMKEYLAVIDCMSVEITNKSNGVVNSFTIDKFLKHVWNRKMSPIRSAIYYKKWHKAYMNDLIGYQKGRNEQAEKKGNAPLVYQCNRCQKIHTTFTQADECHWHSVRVLEWCPIHENPVGECDCTYAPRPSKKEDVYDESEDVYFEGSMK